MAIVTSEATAHQGKKNRYGCHAGTKSCHCHASKEPKPYGVDPCNYEPLFHILETPCFATTKPNTSPSTDNVTASYDKIVKSIKYYLIGVRNKPNLVKSCEEWVLVMQLMSTIKLVTPELLAASGRNCYDIGHQKFGKYMVKLIDRLPI